MRRTGPWWALMAVAVTMLVGCSRPEVPAVTAARQGWLLVGNGTEPAGLDPHVVTGVTEHHIILALFEGLIGVDPQTLEPRPTGVAERWEVSPDGTTYRFFLRPTATWSNGDPVRASDFVYAYHRMLHPDLGAQYGYMLHPLRHAQAYNQRRIGFILLTLRAADPLPAEMVGAVDFAPNSASPNPLNRQGLDNLSLEQLTALRAGSLPFDWPAEITPALQREIIGTLVDYRSQGSPDLWDAARVGVTAESDRILRLDLEQPTPYFLGMLDHYAWYPIHPPTIEKFGGMTRRDSPWTRPGNLVGNGPFRLVSWRVNRAVEVEKRPDYWDAATVRLHGIRFIPIEDTETEQRAFRRGQLHVTETVPIHRLKWAKQHLPDQVRVNDYLGVYYYDLNLRGPGARGSEAERAVHRALSDQRVRQALSLAVDREAIVSFLGAGQQPAYNFTPPMAGYQPPPGLGHDPARARALLAEAGYPEGRGFPRLEILYNTSAEHRQIAEIIQQTWKRELGVATSLDNQEWKVYLATRRRHAFDIVRSAWIGDCLDPHSFLALYLSYAGNNHPGFDDPEFDALIEASDKAMDPRERADLLARAEARLLEGSPCIPLYFYVSRKMIRPELKGWSTNVLDRYCYKSASFEVTSEQPHP